MDDFDYPYEDHGDPSVDERWRRALTREQTDADMDAVDRHAAQVGRTWTPLDPVLDSGPPLVSVDELLTDIARHGA